MPIELIDKLKPKNGAEFPIIDASDIAGGHHSVATIELRDALSIDKRVIGLTCYVESTGIIYILKGGIHNENWEEFKSKGGVHVSDTAPTDEDKSDLIWVLSNGDKITLPKDPSDPTLAAITATLTDYQDRINKLEYLVRGVIDGGTNLADNIDVHTLDPNIDRALIKFRRGNNNDVNILQAGEPALAIDTGDFFIGDGKGGKIHINSAKNLTEDRLLLKSTNDKVFSITVSPEGFINISEYIEKVIEPDPDKPFKVELNTNIDVATRGDYIIYNAKITYLDKLPRFNTRIVDTLLIDNILIKQSDISNIKCSLTSDTSTLFTSGANIPILKHGEIFSISYLLHVNNTITADITNTIIDSTKTVKIY